MIKLIASDIDGTLLRNGAEALNPSLFDLILRLKEKGILFVAASGRQHSSMQKLFSPVKDEISYICENGALNIHNGKVLSTATIDRSLISRVVKEVRTIPSCKAMLSCQDCCYIESRDDDFVDYVLNGLRYYTKFADDFTAIPDDILKFAVWDREHYEESYQHFSELFGSEIRIVTAGNNWFDFVSPDSNKGLALKRLADHLGFSADECIAFGDQYNDVEMLQLAGTSYAMENAAPGIHSYADHVTDSVEKVLERLLTEL